MKIKSLRLAIYLLAVSITFISCGDDDDGSIPTIAERDRTEQQLADNDSLINYLKGHYYNSSLFTSGVNHRIDDVLISEMPVDDNGDYLETPPDPADNTRLWDAIEERTITYLDVEYTYYILRLNQGSGESPEFTDQVRVRYEGFLVETDEVFDGVASPIDLIMQGIGFSGGVIKGWQLILPEFNTATDFTINNGVVEYNDYGLGIMFIPSGLAYFSTPVTGVPSYSNLVFKFELLQFQQTDHDNDGIPSYLEDTNSNLDALDDDTDENVIPDYFDPDDDGDGVNTIDELEPKTYTVDTNMGELEPVLDNNEYEFSRTEENGIITINTVKALDTNSNGVLDYLDADITINYNEEDS